MIKKILSTTGILVILILAGLVVEFQFSKTETKIYRNDNLVGTYRWHVEAERTYINKNSWYRENIMCPRIIKNGGYETPTRCYYRPDKYEVLSRSIINTELTNQSNNIIRRTPFYAYGTRGAYAGILQEMSVFEETDDVEEFPKDYFVNWQPRDTRNYKLVLRLWDLEGVELLDGNYTKCEYTFGNLKVDLKDECDNLERAEVKDDETVWFYFDNKRGDQTLDLDIVDPEEDSAKIKTDWKYRKVFDDPSVNSTAEGKRIISKNQVRCKGNKGFGNIPTDKIPRKFPECHVGDTSDIYELEEIVVYNGGSFNITCGLLNQSDETPMTGTAWVKTESLKFGYSLSNSGWHDMSYYCYSKQPVGREGAQYGFYGNAKTEGFADITEFHGIATDDICSQKADPYNVTDEFNETVTRYNKTADCLFRTERINGTNYLYVDFYGNNTDPTITISDVSTADSTEQDVVKESGFNHLNLSDQSPYSDLVLYMPFDSNISDTTTYDYTENDNDGSLEGGVAYTDSGKYGGAYDFTENYTAYIKTDNADQMHGASEGTVSIWLKFNTSEDRVVVDATDMSDNAAFGFGVNSGYISAEIMLSETGYDRFYSDGPYNDNEWHHAVHVYNGSAHMLYTDGVKNDGIDGDGTGMNGTIDLEYDGDTYHLFGNGFHNYPSTFDSYKGQIDEVMIFNRSLSSTEVSNLYNRQADRFKDSGNQTFAPQNISRGDNRINVSTDSETLLNSNITGRVGQLINSTVSNEGLELFMPFEDSTAKNYDFSGNGNFGDEKGGIEWNSTAGINSTGAYDFDGSDDYVEVGSDLFPTGNYTVSNWFYVDSAGQMQMVNLESLFGSKMDELTPACGLYDGSDKTVRATGNISKNQWYHITCVTNGTDNIIYLNGVFNNSVSADSPVLSSFSRLDVIGTKYSLGGKFFNGTIDNVRIYSRALNSTEIQNLYNTELQEKESVQYSNEKELTGQDEFTISNEADYVWLDTTYNSGSDNGSYSFYSPLLMNDITLETYSVAGADTTPPYYNETDWSIGGTNQTNSEFYFNVTWSDDNNISHWIISENQSGSWTNHTGDLWIHKVGDWYKAVMNFTITASVGTVFNVIGYANDTSGNWNNTWQSGYGINFSVEVLPEPDPIITIERISPTLSNGNYNATQNEFFQVELNVTCLRSDCGDVNVTLDPVSDCNCTDGNCSACGDLFVQSTGSFNYGEYFGLCITPINDSCYYQNVDMEGWGTMQDYDCDMFLGAGTGDCAFFDDGAFDGTGDGALCPSFERNGDTAVTSDDCTVYDCGGDGSTLVPTDYMDLSDDYFAGSGGGDTEKGIIPTGSGTPFYTNKSNNPYTLTSMTAGETRGISFYVNATGSLDSQHEFFAYANKTTQMNISSETAHWNVTIVEETAVADTCSCPGSGSWEIDWTDNCDIQTDCDVSPNDITFTNTGSAGGLTFNATITACDIGSIGSNTAYLGGNAVVYEGTC